MSKRKLEEASPKEHKKSKRKKSSKSSKDSSASSTTGNVKPSTTVPTSLSPQSDLKRKEAELARVYHLKCDILLKGDLSYLEYQELQEELCRLAALKKTLATKK